ncbi:MAG: hypothetical protein H0W48_05940 [Methylibium sp.]|nr:hypothetical protein [Methylibium sp.]
MPCHDTVPDTRYRPELGLRLQPCEQRRGGRVEAAAGDGLPRVQLSIAKGRVRHLDIERGIGLADAVDLAVQHAPQRKALPVELKLMLDDPALSVRMFTDWPGLHSPR